MRINRNCWMPESDVQDNIGRLAAHARKSLQGFAVIRNIAAVPVDQLLRQLDHVLRLASEEPNGLDLVP